MNKDENNIKRKAWAAAVLGIVMPGLGQVYNGELLKGACIFIASVLIAFFGLQVSIYFADKLILPIIALSLILYLAIYILAVIDAFIVSRKRNKQHTKKSYNRWYVYLTTWLAGMFIMFSAGQYINNNFFIYSNIAGTSMQPTINRGDIVLIDKTAGQRTLYQIGDVVVFTNYGKETRILIRRIAGFPGQKVTIGGKEDIVPDNSVFVLSDNTTNESDDTDALIIPIKDLIGKVRILF